MTAQHGFAPFLVSIPPRRYRAASGGAEQAAAAVELGGAVLCFTEMARINDRAKYQGQKTLGCRVSNDLWAKQSWREPAGRGRTGERLGRGVAELLLD
jgi:hypothetical protein